MKRFWGSFAMWLLLSPSVARAELIPEVRSLMARGQSDAAHKLIESLRSQSGVTPELLEALSWIARGELAQKDYEKAKSDAEKTYELAAPLALPQKLDVERHLPIAVGAALEVQAQALAGLGESGKAVELLRRALQKYGQTSIALRLQKNINLLTLEGKPAPELEGQYFLGPKPPRLATLRGKTVLLFFWADWCGDCKAEAPIIAQLRTEFAQQGLTVIAPTQIYGTDVAVGVAPPKVELSQIEEVWRQYYSGLAEIPVPVSAANFRSYGASTVPTCVLISPKGDVTLYHPGKMTYDELKSRIVAILPARAADSAKPPRSQ